MYILNQTHNYRPQVHNNAMSTAMVEEHFKKNGNAPTSLDDLRALVGHIPHPHGCIVKYLARKSRRVILKVA